MSLLRNGNVIGGISKTLLSKIGFSDLTTGAQNLCDGVNELNSNKVSKSGDTMTGDLAFSGTAAISYAGTHNTIQAIKFIDNTADANGNGIAIGSGGQTIIGGGESSNVMKNEAGTGGSETMWVGNDGNVNILTNLQNGWANRKDFSFSSGGTFTAPGEIYSAALAPEITNKCTDVDLTLANNGGTTRNTWFRIWDKNNKYAYYTGVAINANGNVAAYMTARNYKTGTTTNVDNNLILTVAKNGTRSVTVSDASIWRTALGLGTAATHNTGDYAAASHTHSNYMAASIHNIEFTTGVNAYIDFTWSGSVDYTARIIESAKGSLLAYNSISNASDRNLKKDIVDLDDNFLNLLNKIKPRQFRWKKGDEFLNLGFIAQEVDEALNEIGVTDKPLILPGTDDGEKHTDWGLNYNQMIPILWRLCQIQQKKIEDLEAAIKVL